MAWTVGLFCAVLGNASGGIGLIREAILLPLLLATPSGPGPSTRIVAVPDAECQSSEKCTTVFLRDKISETVDLIELNHYYDDLGRHSYDQVIFYEWSHDYSRFHVIAWSLVEKDKAKLPKKDNHRGDFYARWYDREAKVHRVVRSPLFQETWSQTDPERANKKLLEEKYRISFMRPDKVQIR